jgi:hypothetical protein
VHYPSKRIYSKIYFEEKFKEKKNDTIQIYHMKNFCTKTFEEDLYFSIIKSIQMLKIISFRLTVN